MTFVVTSAIVAVAAPQASATTATAAPNGTAPVGVAPTLPAKAVVQDTVAAGVPLHLTVMLEPRDPKSLAMLAQDVSTPGSPEYHHYLAAGQFAQEFGPTDATLTTVEQALATLGLHPGTVTANHLAIPVTTTAGQVASAFQIKERQVRLANGRVAYANDAAPRLPTTIAPAISGILGLDDLALVRPSWQTPPKTKTKTKTETETETANTANMANTANGATAAGSHPEKQATATTAGPQPCAAATTAAGNTGAYTANQVAQAYSFGGLYANGTLGAGVTIAAYELASYQPNDIAAYQACYGTTTSVTNVAVDGGPNPTDPGAIEAELDIEGLISLAPKANIQVYLGPNAGSGPFDVYDTIVSNDTAQVITTSWGMCEALQGAAAAGAENTVFQQAAVQGQTVLAATGDSGSEDCDPANGNPALAVDDPSSQPFVTGVGGTSLAAVSPAPRESVWNDAAVQSGAAGGGISKLWSMPTAQHGAGVVNSYTTASPCHAASGTYCRETPDVSASADPEQGYVVYYTGSETGQTGWQAIGGTSAAAPVWAAVIALADQNCACHLGFVNTALYNIAAAGAGSFNDVTTGNNDYLGVHSGAYPATAGYDMGSGLGTPVAASLAVQLNPTAEQAPVFSSDSPPSAGVLSAAFSYTFAATGRPAPTFSLATGAVPTGLTLNATTGVLSGTPTAPGAFTFTVSAANGIGTAAVTPSLTITISAASSLPGYQALVPVRICDTRTSGAGVVANQCDSHGHSPLSTGGVLTLTVAGAAGVPANAGAVVLHVTATGTNAASYLTVWPTGQAQPTAANLNWTAGQTVPNLVETGVGTGGQVSVFNYSGSADVIVDLQGYVAAAGGLFVPLTPTRVCDTRLAQPGNQCNQNGTAAGTLGAGKSREINVVNGFGVPSGATAVELNVTVTTTSAAGYLDIWPDGTSQPLASSLNWAAGQTISNRVITAVSGAGNIDIFNANGTTDVVVDLGGYFAPAAVGSGYFPVTPSRICDTRAIGAGVASNPCNSSGPGTLAAGHSLSLTGFNPSITAVVVNVTVTDTAGAGFLTVFPGNSATVPLAADITWAAHQTIGNLVVANLGTTGALDIFNGSTGSADVIVDIEGYYSATPPGGG
jgi:Pro-kumamolisin, activation domain/Putative Ig domain